jgi:hypothetical protein
MRRKIMLCSDYLEELLGELGEGRLIQVVHFEDVSFLDHLLFHKTTRKWLV